LILRIHNVNNLVFLVNVSALVLALIGIIISGWQLRKSKNASEAAESATKEAKEILHQSVSSDEISRIIKDLKFLSKLIDNDKFEVAHYAISEHIHPHLIHLSKLEPLQQDNRVEEMRSMKANLASIRDTLREKTNQNRSVDLSSDRKTVIKIADQLENWAQEDKLRISTGGNKDDS